MELNNGCRDKKYAVFCILVSQRVRTCSALSVVARNKRKVNVASYRAIVMDRREEETREAAPPPCLTSKKIVLPIELILYMAEFLSFVDYRSFIRSLWPNNDESPIFREKLWKMSTYKNKTVFMNGQILELEYNFDPSRKRDDRYLFNLDSLSPVFGGISFPRKDKFVNKATCKALIKMHVHVNMCTAGDYASCTCHMPPLDSRIATAFAIPPRGTCKYRHFHHYCSQHVRQWFDLVTNPLIRGARNLSTEFILSLLDDSFYFRGEPSDNRRRLQ